MLNRRGALRIGRIFGAWLSIHPAFVLLAAIDIITSDRGVWWWVAAMASLVWHELGHATAAKGAGLRVAEIEVHMLGGRTEVLGSTHQQNLIWIFLAGPAASAVLGLALLVAGLWTGGTSFAASVLLWGKLNLAWGALNMIPVYPLDGGHVLRAALSNNEGPRDSAAITLALSSVVGVVLAVVSFLRGWWAVGAIAVFVVVAGYREWQRQGLPSVRRSYNDLRSRRRRARFRVIRGGRGGREPGPYSPPEPEDDAPNE